MGLVVRTIGIARARIKISMANLVYNFQRLAWPEAGLRLLDAQTAPERASAPQQPLQTAGKRAFVRSPYFSMPQARKSAVTGKRVSVRLDRGGWRNLKKK